MSDLLKGIDSTASLKKLREGLSPTMHPTSLTTKNSPTVFNYRKSSTTILKTTALVPKPPKASQTTRKGDYETRQQNK